MGLKQIECTLKITEEENTSRAAMKLFTSQSTLNQQLLKLGKEPGAPLFYRTRHNWEPTEVRKLYVWGVRETVLTKKSTRHRVADVLDRPRRSFFLGMSGGQGIAMFTSIYPRFLQMHPNASISSLEIESYGMQNMIVNGNLSLGFITTGPRGKTSINYTHICSEEFCIAPSSSHPIARPIKSREEEYPQLGPRLLKGELFVLMHQKPSCRAVIDPIFQEAEFSPNILSETPSAASIPSFVPSGICRAIISKCYIKDMNGISLFSLPSHPYQDLDFYHARQSYINQPLRILTKLSKDCWKSYYQDQWPPNYMFERNDFLRYNCQYNSRLSIRTNFVIPHIHHSFYTDTKTCRGR